MARHRDFDAARNEATAEPLTFTLGGREFHCRPVLPAGVLLDMAATTHGSDMEAFASFTKFLDAVIAPEDLDAFHDALGTTIDLWMLLELVQWIIVEATGRPFPNASSSPEPPSEIGEEPKVVSLQPVTEARSA